MANRAITQLLDWLRSGLARLQGGGSGNSALSSASSADSTSTTGSASTPAGSESAAVAATGPGHPVGSAPPPLDADPLAYLSAAVLRQPDGTSCGSASLVFARMLADPGLARSILDHQPTSASAGIDPDGAAVQARFTAVVLRTHEVTNAVLDADRRLQIPWPASLGTLPWSAARFLNGGATSGGGSLFGVQYDVQLIDPANRAAGFDVIAAITGRGLPCPLYVGDGYSPRHVVLGLPHADGDVPGTVRVYEPSAGVLLTWTRDMFCAADFVVAGWPQPWLVVRPQPAD
jgi:hypothetical protein